MNCSLLSRRKDAMTIEASKLPYRPCVGAMILNPAGLVWVGRRADAPGDPEGRGSWWQMPQGGIDEGEDPAKAVFREVQEETGMTSLEIAAELPGWHLYDLPQELLAQKVWGGKYRGQKQKWFALRFKGHDREIDITPANGPAPEFEAWRWAPAAELLDTIVPFKRDVYRAVLAEAAKLNLY
jgi:putative (di)nucleoside polyphosphate hydrolase